MDKLNEQEMDELTRILLNTEEQCQMVDQMIKKTNRCKRSDDR